MRRALVVGINDYSWAPLQGCIKDAQNMGRILGKHFDGQPNFHVRTLTSDNSIVTRAQLFRAIQELLERPASVALLFFSGHGAQDKLGGHLVTQDSEKHNLGVALNDIVELANMTTHIAEIVIIVDACHSGHTGNTNPLNKDITTLRKGVSVLASSLQSEFSVEYNGQGLFTSIVTEALEGGGSDVLGQVSVAGVYNYVDKALGPWEQRPVFKSHVTELSTLRLCKPQMPIDHLREICKYFSPPNFEYSLDPLHEPNLEPRNSKKEEIYKFLLRARGSNLLEPVGEEHMYYAAKNSKSCKLTNTGKLYWRMVNNNKI
ncbi:MAG: caspase family protein [Roseivirga sp.]|nr:caspase family protein [Roseivirga sp.]